MHTSEVASFSCRMSRSRSLRRPSCWSSSASSDRSQATVSCSSLLMSAWLVRLDSCWEKVAGSAPPAAAAAMLTVRPGILLLYCCCDQITSFSGALEYRLAAAPLSMC
jgi:hypothetical protein